jgi:hypothetical protein
LSTVQGPFSVAPCQTLALRFATLFIAVCEPTPILRTEGAHAPHFMFERHGDVRLRVVGGGEGGQRGMKVCHLTAIKKRIVILGFGTSDREWLLNDGQIQKPLGASVDRAVSDFVPRGFGFVHHSIAILYRAVPNPNITVRNFCIAAHLDGERGRVACAVRGDGGAGDDDDAVSPRATQRRLAASLGRQRVVHERAVQADAALLDGERRAGSRNAHPKHTFECWHGSVFFRSHFAVCRR